MKEFPFLKTRFNKNRFRQNSAYTRYNIQIYAIKVHETESTILWHSMNFSYPVLFIINKF